LSATNEKVEQRTMIRHRIEVEREDDGRWLADVVTVPGAMAYGETREIAIARAKRIAILEVTANRADGPLSVESYIALMKEIEAEIRGAELFEVKS
jgi:predicted RNase H-like HicB family nuclease